MLLLDDSLVNKIQKIMQRLFDERRLTGDEMRDLAQSLEWILQQGIEVTKEDIAKI